MPTRDEIKNQVIIALSKVTAYPDLAKKEESGLWNDLKIGQNVSTMVGLLSDIAKSYPGGKEVTMNDVGGSKTVKDVIDLVFGLARGVTRDEIKNQVIIALSKVTSFPEFAKKEESLLYNDLGIGPAALQAMAGTYTKIAKNYKYGIEVSMGDAGDCNTVKDAIDLVFDRAKGV